MGQKTSHLLGKSGNLRLQSSDGGMALGELRRQFGGALLGSPPFAGTFPGRRAAEPDIQDVFSLYRPSRRVRASLLAA